MTYRFVIVGRGIVGLSLAWEALCRGHSVVVVGPDHKKTPLHFGHTFTTSTKAALGLSSIKGHFDPKAPLFREKLIGHHGLSQWLSRLEKEANLRIPKVRGSLFEPFFSEKEYLAKHERIYHGSFHGFFRNRLLFGNELETSLLGAYARKKDSPHFTKDQRENALNKNTNLSQRNLITQKIIGSFVYDDDLWFDPSSCLTALETAISKRGGIFIDGVFSGLKKFDESSLDPKYQKIDASRQILNKKFSFFYSNISHQKETSSFDLPHQTDSRAWGNILILACGPLLNQTLKAIGAPNIPFKISSGVTIHSKYDSSDETKKNFSQEVDPPSFSELPQFFMRRQRINIILRHQAVSLGSTSFERRYDLDGAPSETVATTDAVNTIPLIKSSIYPEFTLPKPTTIIWGARVKTKDRSPAIGPLSDITISKAHEEQSLNQTSQIFHAYRSNIWISTGFYKNGLQLAWKFAEYTLKAIEQSDPSAIDEPFRLARLNSSFGTSLNETQM